MIFNLPPNFFTSFLWNQFHALPPPSGDFAGKTAIVTGGNVGLGLEACRHFVSLGSKKVVLACRDTEKGEAAKADIEASTQTRGVVEVWPVDLSSFESVKAFCRRAEDSLDRLDFLVENAGLATGEFEEADGGYESTIAINVVSTFLMALMLLPKLRQTTARFNFTPRLVIVASDAHFFRTQCPGHFFVSSGTLGALTPEEYQARFSEKTQPNIFEAFRDPSLMSADRYNVSKLIEILVVRQLAQAIDVSDKSRVVLNCVNPGFCRSQLFRQVPFPLSYVINMAMLVIGRTTEMGSRTLMAAATAGDETHGKYMDSCVVADESPFVRSEEGAKVQKRLTEELLVVLDGIEPGVSKNI